MVIYKVVLMYLSCLLVASTWMLSLSTLFDSRPIDPIIYGRSAKKILSFTMFQNSYYLSIFKIRH